mmetsp:Transcript_43585/g.124942  ORF Transcript_43585/g.124942 Transcript_43585/m.124942 type:complete len:234 (+) Transcript_43585:490-1191(+)
MLRIPTSIIQPMVARMRHPIRGRQDHAMIEICLAPRWDERLRADPVEVPSLAIPGGHEVWPHDVCRERPARSHSVGELVHAGQAQEHALVLRARQGVQRAPPPLLAPIPVQIPLPGSLERAVEAAPQLLHPSDGAPEVALVPAEVVADQAAVLAADLVDAGVGVGGATELAPPVFPGGAILGHKHAEGVVRALYASVEAVPVARVRVMLDAGLSVEREIHEIALLVLEDVIWH